jgi:hypothetical protein
MRPYLEKSFRQKKKKNRTGVVAQGEGSVFKPQHTQKKRKSQPDSCHSGTHQEYQNNNNDHW